MIMADKFEIKETDKARDLLRAAIESLNEGFALYDEDRCLVMFNKRYAEMNKGVADLLKPGLDWEILIRESARRGIYADAIGNEDEWIADRLINGVEFIQDYELTETDGKTYLVSVHPTDLGGFVVTREDITDKKQIEAAERDGDLLIRTVIDASSALIIMARIGDGQILYRSPRTRELFGNTKSAREHYANAEDRADFITQLLADGQVDDYRLTAINAKEDEIEISISARFAEYKGEEVIVTSIVDLTEQLEADALVRRVMEACPAPVQMTKLDSGELLFSSYESSANSSPAEISRSSFHPPDDRVNFLDKLKDKGWINDYRAEFIDENGRQFPGAVSANLIDFKGEEVMVSTTRDLTDEIALQEELTSQREMLFQNEKMSALGELLAGVAHELNNPLSVVVGHSMMMREEVTDPELSSRIEKIGNAAERCAKIVKTFLAMARQQPAKIEEVDINSVIEVATDVAGYGEKSTGVAIKSELACNLPAIAADADQITQVIINLIINGAQAIKSSRVGDTINVSSRLDDNGASVEIIVEDNGPGISENIRARIFEPFFTTKEVGEGTGIGLAFCHRVVLSHGGQLRLDPDTESGSRFRISLPVTQLSGPQAEIEEQRNHPDQNLKALVVDDELEVGELTAEIVRREGFDVDFVTNGAEAINLLKQNTYDVFLSDMNMPEVDGQLIYKTLASELPEMLDKTAFVTGDTMGQTSQKVLRESGLPHVEKPVSPTEFRELLAKLTMKNKGDQNGK